MSCGVMMSHVLFCPLILPTAANCFEHLHGPEHEETEESRRNWERFQREHGPVSSKAELIPKFVISLVS